MINHNLNSNLITLIPNILNNNHLYTQLISHKETLINTKITKKYIIYTHQLQIMSQNHKLNPFNNHKRSTIMSKRKNNYLKIEQKDPTIQ